VTSEVSEQTPVLAVALAEVVAEASAVVPSVVAAEARPASPSPAAAAAVLPPMTTRRRLTRELALCFGESVMYRTLRAAPVTQVSMTCG